MMSVADRLASAPKGTKLWCTILGEVELVDVNWNRTDYPIKVIRPNGRTFDDQARSYDVPYGAGNISFTSKWDYIVPVSKFDFNDLQSNYKRSIV